MNSFANGGVILRMVGFFLASLIEAKKIPAHSQLAEEFSQCGKIMVVR